MNALTLVRAHVKVQFLDLIRWPGYVVPTVLFPALFFVMFDLPYARTSAANAAPLTLAFIVFAVVGVAFYQFGVGIAQERGRPWERYLRTLPVWAIDRFAARVITATAFAVLTAGVVAITARILTPIDLSLAQWLRVLLYCVAGGVPFVLIGITVGYWVSARAAIPVATGLNLLLAYAGGLLVPPQYLPSFLAPISPYLPTREFADLLWSVIHAANVALPVVGLAAYAVVFAALAAIGYARDDRRRYA